MCWIRRCGTRSPLARTHGIVVLLVTGRILDELRRVAGDLHFVDGVIAENGAVIHFPDSGRTTALAPLVPESFVAELRRRGIPFAAGQCLVDADAERGAAAAGGHSHTRIAARPHLQSRARDDRATGRQQGDRASRGARDPAAVRPQHRRDRRRRERPRAPATGRSRRRGRMGQQGFAGGRRRRARRRRAGGRRATIVRRLATTGNLPIPPRAAAVVCCSGIWRTVVNSRSRCAAATCW